MKPLKILLGNNTLSLLAGSETWTYTLALALKELGHDVSCFSPELGVISDNLKVVGIPSYNIISKPGTEAFSFILQEEIKHDYDVIIANHNHIVAYLREQFPKTPIISTIHGIIHKMVDDDGNEIDAPEHPALSSGVNEFVSVSREIQDILKKKYNIASVLIPNSFDIKKLIEIPVATKDIPKTFLINTNYNGRDDKHIMAVREAAKHFGASVIALGVNFSSSFDIISPIKKADVVFGMGRSVLEGVAAGRLGIVHGRWGTGGAITAESVESLAYNNFSGRPESGVLKSNEPATAQELIKMIEENYNPKTLAWGRKYMATNHNVLNIAEAYVRLARELTGQVTSTPAPIIDNRRPYRLAKDVTTKN